MEISKRPIVLYDGVLKQLKDEDNVGKYILTVVSKNPDNDFDELYSFTQIHANTATSSFSLLLPQNPSEGDFIKILDVKSVFDGNPLYIKSNGKKIEGTTTDITLDVNGAIVDFIYSGDEDGWLIDIGGRNLNVFDDAVEYSISPSTAEMGSRVGHLVYQTEQANTVDIADASDITRVPTLGVIQFDNDTRVQVKTKTGSVVDVKIDPNIANQINPGDHVFIASTRSGYATLDPDNDSTVVYQVIGICNDFPDGDGFIKLNLWLNPEIYA